MKKMMKPKYGHSHGRGGDHIPDAEHIKEILDVVSDRVPDLLKQLSDVLYGTDQAKKFGRAAAVFYKELKDTGMSKDEIFELTRQYMATLNIGNVFGKFAKEHEHEKEFGEEIGKHVRKKIRKELEEK
jgi:hypothetical protein